MSLVWPGFKIKSTNSITFLSYPHLPYPASIKTQSPGTLNTVVSNIEFPLEIKESLELHVFSVLTESQLNAHTLLPKKKKKTKKKKKK